MSSPRRGVGEINILAMLDGQSRKPRATRKWVWLGAGTVLACILAGILVWLVRTPSGGFDDHRIAVDLPDTAPVAASLPVLAPAPLPAPRHGAAIVDLPTPDAAGELPFVETGAAATLPAKAVGAQPAAKPAPHPRAPKAAPLPPRQATPLRARRPLAAAQPGQAPATVDTDVALISAIIQHVNQRGTLKDDAGCGGQPCPATMPNRP